MPNLFYYVAKGKTVTPPKVIEINAGGNYSMAITNKRVTWGWGANTFGQLGDNTITQKITPVSVLGTVKTFCHISAGGSNDLNHTMAIDKDGRAWGWGYNQFGQLGNNSTTSRRTPVSVAGAVKTFCQISAGQNHTLTIDKNGRAWGWGLNGNGELGDNSTTSRQTPVSIVGAVKTFCQISAGSAPYTMAIDKNGRAWGWGQNASGQLGINSTTSQRTPVSVLGAVKTFCQISAGDRHTAAIDKNGRVWCWGNNVFGQLGDGTGVQKNTPVSIIGAVKTFCHISAGGSNGSGHTMAIDKDGRAWGWGWNNNGQLGDNSIANKFAPVSVQGAVKTFCKISAGQNHTIAIDKNGKIWAWGNNINGELGAGISPNFTPLSVIGVVKTFCQISAGQYHATTIDKNGRAWGWGLNSSGQLGDNSTSQKNTPVSVLGTVKTFCKISAGYTHTMAIDKNGRAWGWGSNGNGRLGDNSTTNRITPVSVLGAVKTFCHIAGGGFHTIAIDKNGRAWGWGWNVFGQLGDTSTAEKRTPVSVLGAVKTFCQISAGEVYSVAIDKNGRAWGWGQNPVGQLGDNSITSQRTPVSVLGTVKTFCKISAGLQHTMAIDKNGRAWGWGSNTGGKIGDNSTTSRRTPVSVLGAVKTFCQISAGSTHTMAIDKDGRAWGWGRNSDGQLGQGNYTQRNTPVSVAGAVKTFCHIAAGGDSISGYTLAIDKNGRAWAWGINGYGQLGIGFATTTPILITYL